MSSAQPHRSRVAGLPVWLSILGLVLLFLPLSLLSRAIRTAESAALETLDNNQTQLASTALAPETISTLTENRLDYLSQAQELSSVRDQVVALHSNFPAITSILLNYRPQDMMLTQVVQGENGSSNGAAIEWLMISGEAHTEAQVMDYVGYLRTSDLFDRVDVQTLTLQSTVPGTLPVQTAVEGTEVANPQEMPRFERGLQWVTFSLRLTWEAHPS